jgi:hypothetical protein
MADSTSTPDPESCQDRPLEATGAPRTSFPDPIPSILPFGSIGTLAGATGVGKTAFIASWIARWQGERTICGHTTHRPPGIGLITADRRAVSHRQWLRAAGCRPIPLYSLRDDDTFPWTDLRIWPRVKDLFARAVDALVLPAGGLVVVDPMAVFLPGRVNDYKDVALGLGILDQVLRPRHLTLVGIFHQAKQIADTSQRYLRPQDRILGSAAQLGFSDTAMYLMAPDEIDRPYYGFGWVPHHAPAATFGFARTADGLFVPYEGPLDEGQTRESDRPTRLLELIPQDGEISTGALEERAKTELVISRATVHRDLKVLLSRRRITRDAHGRITRRKVH